MTTSIRASVLHRARDLRVVRPSLQYPIDSLKLTADCEQEPRQLEHAQPNELQIAIQATTLCGSDIHYYENFRNGDIHVQEPLTLGHESAGVVASVGSDVADFSVGDRVALEVGLPCSKCERCSERRYNICPTMRFRSSAKSLPHFQGTLQERINHPAAFCHK